MPEDQKLKKKIIIFAHDSSLYGASLSLLALLESLKNEQLFKILIILPYNGIIEQRLNKLNIEYEIIPFPRCVIKKSKSVTQRIKVVFNYYKSYFRVLPTLLSLVHKFKPDLIYTNTSIVSIGYIISKRLNVYHIWHIREHGDFEFKYIPNKRKIINYLINSGKVIFVTNELKRNWGFTKVPNSIVVHNGVASGIRKVPIATTSNRFRIGLVGAITPQKGQSIAIDAFKLILNVYSYCELHLHGDIKNYTYYNELLILIKGYGLEDKVVFHSFTSDIESIYKDMDLLLCCSVNEGFGRTIIEAMARGIPVIANANGGPLEIISDKVDGLLYDNSKETLAESILSILSNPKLYFEISESALRKAQNEFSLDKYTNHMLSIFRQALK